MDKLKVVIILLLLMHIATGINGMECNGMEGLCDLRIDQVTFPAAHNAGSDPNVAGECLWRNQNYDPLNQFIRGIRFFDFDTCWHEDKVKHCHCNEYFGCAYGADMSTTLVNFDNVMKYNWSLFGFDFRYEVIILYFNRDADISGETAKEKIGKSLDEILTNLWDPDGNGLLKMNNYYKNNNNQWPTLRQTGWCRVMEFSQPLGVPSISGCGLLVDIALVLYPQPGVSVLQVGILSICHLLPPLGGA